MNIDLSVAWAVLILFSVMMYVIMDGFDLGIGMLFPFFPDKEERDVMMNTVAPVWDGNETWLVLGGAGLLAAFPLAYSLVLSALYLPIILMLVGLIFRGVAFEFRFKASVGRVWLWDLSFTLGSAVATFFQGVVLGAFIQGLELEGLQYRGGALGWLKPFPLFAGLGLMVAYLLLGATWLIMKTEDELQQRARRLACYMVWLLLATILIISLWTPLSLPGVAQRWFAWPNLLWLSPVPVLVAVAAWLLLRALVRESHAKPFLLTLLLVFLGYLGLGISLWPNVIPPDIDIWQAAGPRESQAFALVGALLVTPLVLAYTAFSYWIFRGKIRKGAGYHH